MTRFFYGFSHSVSTATKVERSIVYHKAHLESPYQASRSPLDAIDYNPDDLSMSSIFQHALVFVPHSRRLLWLQAFTKGEQVGAPTLLNEVISPSQFLVHYNNINSKRGDWAKLEEYLRQCYRSIQRELKRQ